MIKNLLNPKWQHADAAVRRQAIEEGQLKDDILLELARTDPDPDVRSLAVSHVQELKSLITLTESVKDAERAGVPARLHELILAADTQAEPDLDTLQRCYELCANEQLRQSLLLHAPYAALRRMAAEGVHQDNVLEQCVLNDKAGEVRRAAVQQIEDEAVLRRIARQLRNSDKSTARLADEKRALMQQQREKLVQQQELLSQLQVYANGDKPLNDAVIDKLLRQWEGIAADADDEARRRFDSLHSTLQPQLEQQRILQEKDREGRSIRETVLQTLASLAEPESVQDPADSERRLTEARARWHQLEAMHNTGAQQRFEQDFDEAAKRVEDSIRQQKHQHGIEQRLAATINGFETLLQAEILNAKDVSKARKQCDSLIESTTDKQAFEKPLQQMRNLVERLEQALQSQQERDKTLHSSLKSLVETLEAALDDKALKAALAAHKKAHDLLVIAGETRPSSLKNLEKRLHHCEPMLRELKSWRNWGTDHAREELVKEAIALRDAPPGNIAKLAKRINDLRDRWKKLGPLEPGGKAHWEKFDAACTEAHAPVKAMHDAEAEERRQHLEQRKSICKQLEELVTDTDWDEQPDWHSLDKAMGAARRQWNKTGGVPHKAWPGIRKRYDRAIKDLDNHLAQERERNFVLRQQLVHKAEQLAQEQDNRAATAAARELRKQWQISVRSPNRKEKKLWQAFNNAMDQVFQKDRAARDQFKASLDENHHKAEALCEQLEQLAAADDQSVRSRKAELKQARELFAALNLPNKTRRQLENRFDKACDAFKQRMRSVDNAFKQQQLEKLYALHNLCVRLEALALEPQPDKKAADEIQSHWAKAEKPAKEKSSLHRIEQRYQAALAVINGERSTDVFGDLAVNADRKSTICTDLEILLHLETPAEDRNHRMQRQVELMENAMKGVDQNSPDRIRELKLTFMGCGPVEIAIQRPLEQRFSLLLNASM